MATMTRQHFELIAGVLREELAKHDYVSSARDVLRLSLPQRFADALATTNRNFNHDRFIAAATRKAN